MGGIGEMSGIGVLGWMVGLGWVGVELGGMGCVELRRSGSWGRVA